MHTPTRLACHNIPDTLLVFSLAVFQALLLALRLWHRLPTDALARCKLLPHGGSPPPFGFWDAPDSVPRSAIEPTATAVLSVGHMTALLPLLLASSSSHPRLHQIWGCLLALLLPGFKPTKDPATAAAPATANGSPATAATAPAAATDATSKPSPDAAQLAAFWGVVVEGALFTSPSHERKHLGLTLFQLVLPHLDADSAQVVLSQQFLRCLGNSMKDKQSYLHVSAKRCVVSEQPCVIVPLVCTVLSVSAITLLALVSIICYFGLPTASCCAAWCIVKCSQQHGLYDTAISSICDDNNLTQPASWFVPGGRVVCSAKLIDHQLVS